MKKYFFLIVCISFLACKSKVEKIKPTRMSITESIYASGIIKSDNQYQAYATVNGIVEQVFVQEGDSVNIGSPLLAIANEAQQLNKQNALLAANYGNVSANQGKLNDAFQKIILAKNKLSIDSAIYVRQKALWQQQIGSRVEFEQKELAFQQSKNTYESALVQYNDLKRQVDFNAAQANTNLLISGKLEKDYTLKSEVKGIVYSITKSKGDLVNLQTPIAVIGDANHFILEMQVDEEDILNIKKGLKVMVTLDSYKDKVFEAIVTKIDPIMDERSKTFLVEATFIAQPPVLYPNITFEANIVLQTKSNALLIPRNYLFHDSMVTKSNGDKVLVKTGLRDYQQIEILSGINQDDELIKPTE